MTYPALFSYRKHWARRFGTAPFLPMSREEMNSLEWDSCDVILITGDAYVDHPSFGMALVGRLLEAQGFRVGIIAQPDWTSAEDFQKLGRPNLFFGVTAGNMDSMVNRYTTDRKIRRDDAYTPEGKADARPDRAVIVYSNRCREAYSDVPVIIGGIEASLRRIAHYDYWSDKVRRSIIFDAKADLLVFGNGERQIVEIAHRIAKRESPETLTDIRGCAHIIKTIPDEITVIDAREAGTAVPVNIKPAGTSDTNPSQAEKSPLIPSHYAVRIPDYEKVIKDKVLYAHASRIMHLETKTGNGRTLLQKHGDRYVKINPPAFPLSTEELDAVFDLPYQRVPHPVYGNAKIPAYEMIRFSVNIMRGCFGGCSFCSITEHEGRVIQSRSVKSIVAEVEKIRDKTPGFTGYISDLGGPTANMYRMNCRDPEIEKSCRKLSCVFPSICRHLLTDHKPIIDLYRNVRQIPGIKKAFVASGVRYDIAATSPEYIKELAEHHTGGYLKIAPEHTESGPLSLMMKPEIDSYYRFKELFDRFSSKAGKEQYLIPYFIAAHPGTTDEDMLNLALWLKENDFRPDQVQTFLPSPMSLSSAMYHTGKNPLRKVDYESEEIAVPAGLKIRKLHKAFLRYHDAVNWPLLREALKKMGRDDLIGNKKHHLVPNWQPKTETFSKKKAYRKK